MLIKGHDNQLSPTWRRVQDLRKALTAEGTAKDGSMAVYADGRESAPVALADLVLEHVRSVVPEGITCELSLDTSLYDIGLDSLTRMGVVNRLEESLQIRFPEESLYDLETCGDVVQLIEQQLAPPANPPANPPNDSAKPASSQSSAPARRVIHAEHHDVACFPECVALDQRLAHAAAAGVHNPFFRTRQRRSGATATMEGRDIVCFTSFDYLGMSSTAELASAATAAIQQFGTSASASRLVGGESAILQELDEELARFVGTEAAAVFPSGYGTNATLFAHLFGPEDLILYDELAHNSIVQGALLSKARRRTFPHNDFRFVDRLLADVRTAHRRVVVAIEGVYSMDGDYPDLPEFMDVKKRHKALLYVDEAHSLGVLGASGRGICEHFDVDPADGDLWMGTISKAFGSGGGYIAGRKSLIQYLRYTAPAFVFATAASPANAAAALAAVRLLREQPERVTQLRERSQLFLKLAQDCGLDTGASRDTPIVPIILGDSLQCIHVSHQLLLQGIDAQPILYPAVPESAARVRFFITVDHTEEQICRTVQALADCISASTNALC